MGDPVQNFAIEHVSVHALRPNPRNARTHSRHQVRKIAKSIQRFGFTNPVLVGDDLTIIAGHGRIEAAKLLGMEKVPAVRLSHLGEAEKRAYVLADNKLALEAGWDREMLAIEFQGLIDLGFEIELTGFAIAEIDLTLEEAAEAEGQIPGPEDDAPDLQVPAVSRVGDAWILGRHRILCGDAREHSSYEVLLGDERADLVFTDVPYNVRIGGNVSGKGRIKHREFAMASGEMSESEFTAFLSLTLGHAAGVSRDGALQYVFIDWRHLFELLTAGREVYSELLNLVV